MAEAISTEDEGRADASFVGDGGGRRWGRRRVRSGSGGSGEILKVAANGIAAINGLGFLSLLLSLLH